MEKEIGWLLQEKYNGKMTAGAKRDIKRFEAGEPLDHIIGFVEFLGSKILVDKTVLIPRFETEFWAEKVVDELKNRTTNLKVLDMFAGSGCVGISIMRHIPKSHVVFADSQKDCISQIKKNCKVNNFSAKRYKAIQSDIFSNVSGRFDYIVANPPYIPIVKKDKLQKSVLDYEPHAALFGGIEGLSYIKQFLAAAKKFLNEDGKIYMEFDSFQKPAIAKMLEKEGYQHWQFHKDQYGRWRYVVAGKI